jgi:hypothetical protein
MPPASLRPPRNEPERSFPLCSAVELLAWLPILVGHTARVVNSLDYHLADSKRAQRAVCNEDNSNAILRINVIE